MNQCKPSFIFVIMPILFIITSFNVLNSQNHEAIQILEKANKACKELKSIKFKSIIKDHSSTPSIIATVTFMKDMVADIGFGEAKMTAIGERYINEKKVSFKFSYNGEDFKFKEKNDSILTINKPTVRAVGRTLGLNYYIVPFIPFGSINGIDHVLKAKEFEYLGIENVNGKDAYCVNVIREFKYPGFDDIKTSASKWYFEKETYLPIKFSSNSGKSVREFEIIETNKDYTKNIFDINKVFKENEKQITGLEANTSGLLTKGNYFPDFSLKDFNGNSFDKEVFKSKKVTIIDFWGTWCGPCKIAMPELQELFTEYNKHGINIIGISVGDKPNKPEEYVKSKNYTYQFLENGESLAKKLKLNTYPTIFIVDSDGKVIHSEKGIRKNAKEDFRKIINKHLIKD